MASPNNPTGALTPTPDLIALCRVAREAGAIVVVDEAYIEFAGMDKTAVKLLPENPNLIVLRTFSKWSGLAGLRVGYAIAHENLITRIMAIKQPYNVTVTSGAAAIEAIAQRDVIYADHVAPMVAERDRIAARLAREYPADFQPLPSDANYILVRVKRMDAGVLKKELRSRGVLVRYFPTGQLARCVRISAGRPKDTEKLFDALADIMGAPTCLLLDMDGVLADVGDSYRASIVATAAAYGVEVTRRHRGCQARR